MTTVTLKGNKILEVNNANENLIKIYYKYRNMDQHQIFFHWNWQFICCSDKSLFNIELLGHKLPYQYSEIMRRIIIPMKNISNMPIEFCVTKFILFETFPSFILICILNNCFLNERHHFYAHLCYPTGACNYIIKTSLYAFRFTFALHAVSHYFKLRIIFVAFYAVWIDLENLHTM